MDDTKTVLVVDSDDKSRDLIFASAAKSGQIPIFCSSCDEARSLLALRRFNVVFCSDTLPDGKYAEVISAAKPTPVIVVSRLAEWGAYVAALHVGAFDYLASPPHAAEVDRILLSALKESSQALRAQPSAA
jgi:two-component system, NtrC family, response regulator PilR